MTGFPVRTVRTSVGAAHATPFPEVVERAVWFFEPIDAAVVLGSTQALSTLDLGEVHRRRLDVVRRHSGGGAVVVDAESLSWFDVWLPAGDPLFEQDVSASAVWLGGTVAEVLRSSGLDATVLDAAAVERLGRGSPFERLVCFAGLAAGEVVVDGRKAVGISQRRTRAGARFQVMILHRLDPTATAALFVLGDDDRARLDDRLRRCVYEVEVDPIDLSRALEQALSLR